MDPDRHRVVVVVVVVVDQVEGVEVQDMVDKVQQPSIRLGESASNAPCCNTRFRKSSAQSTTCGSNTPEGRTQHSPTWRHNDCSDGTLISAT